MMISLSQKRRNELRGNFYISYFTSDNFSSTVISFLGDVKKLLTMGTLCLNVKPVGENRQSKTKMQ